VNHPFRPGWSLRLGPLRLRSVPWYWAVLRDRLREASAKSQPLPPSTAHHDHYCEECDRAWIHEGHTCAQPWAVPCPEKSHGGADNGAWLIVVRGDRAELGRYLDRGFETDPRVTVVVDRRRRDRRTRSTPPASVAVERRRWRDRRLPRTAKDGSVWASLGFQVLPASLSDLP
jgi:hypothetical protein